VLHGGIVILQHANGLSFYQYPNLNQFDELIHGVFTRKSGFSRHPFRSLNVGLSTGDDEKHVNQNRHAIADCMGTLSPVFSKQLHGKTVINLDRIDRLDKTHDHVSGLPVGNLVGPPEGDAMVTSLSGIMPVIQVADCQPVFLFDPKKKVVANIHSGWRGSINNIIGHTIRCMSSDFNTAPSDIIAGIGPSLGPCCAEFKNYRKEIPEQYWKYEIGSRYFDFWAISRDQLMAAGVLNENICISEICTVCNSDLFFSYRKEKSTGRFAAVIGIK
jgi:purine-nucleoside/S-methyl-5'-thioadenosine phosphorylase / adenosine deaminase